MPLKQLGPYDIGERIGKGGMGSVYRGTDRESGQVAAIKVLAPQLAQSEGFRERFEAEIESLKTLRHEGIVRLMGYGKDRGALFYSMELVDGKSLDEEIKAGRRFSWRETVDIAQQVCRALKHAHDHGIVHRDIKPANYPGRFQRTSQTGRLWHCPIVWRQSAHRRRRPCSERPTTCRPNRPKAKPLPRNATNTASAA